MHRCFKDPTKTPKKDHSRFVVGKSIWSCRIFFSFQLSCIQSEKWNYIDWKKDFPCYIFGIILIFLTAGFWQNNFLIWSLLKGFQVVSNYLNILPWTLLVFWCIMHHLLSYSLFKTETHKPDHHLEPVYQQETFLDRDYCLPQSTGYNYLDPNYFPANRWQGPRRP